MVVKSKVKKVSLVSQYSCDEVEVCIDTDEDCAEDEEVSICTDQYSIVMSVKNLNSLYEILCAMKKDKVF